MQPTEFLKQLPSEDSLRDELADTLKRADAIRELLKVARRLPKPAAAKRERSSNG